MCGIIGLITKRNNGFVDADRKLFSDMLVIDGKLRGMDSTGVFQIQNNKDVHTLKNSVNAMLFEADDEYAKIMQRMFSSGRMIVGHNRAATKGKVIPENSHPFHKDHIILVHNGTLFTHRTLANTEVDSEAIAHAIANEGYEKVIPKLDGAFALVWYDMNEEKLYAVRNKERPLSIIETDEVFIISSEVIIPQMLLARKGVKIVNATTNIEPGVVYEWDMKGTMVMDEEPLSLRTLGGGNYGCGYGDYDTTSIDRRVTGNVGTVRQHQSQNRTCALTHSTPSTTTALSDSKDTNVLNIHGDISKHFSIGDTIVVRANSVTHSGNDKARLAGFKGSVLMPGKPTTDIVGLFSLDYINHYAKEQKSPGTENKYTVFALPFQAVITAITSSTCGWSIHVKDAHPAPHVTTWNGQKFSVLEWKYICQEEMCQDCTMIPDPEAAEVTHVLRTQLGIKPVYKVECADCIRERLIKSNAKQEVLDEFESRYLAVQERIELREELERASRSATSTPSSTNILH
jgi:hypothetical protein